MEGRGGGGWKDEAEGRGGGWKDEAEGGGWKSWGMPKGPYWREESGKGAEEEQEPRGEVENWWWWKGMRSADAGVAQRDAVEEAE